VYFLQEGWCDSVGSVEEIQSKILMRQEAAAKRERAMAYAPAHQVCIFLKYKANQYTLINQCGHNHSNLVFLLLVISYRDRIKY
jgi:hypothetical protein